MLEADGGTDRHSLAGGLEEEVLHQAAHILENHWIDSETDVSLLIVSINPQ